MNQKYNYDKSELFQLFDEVKIEKRIKSLIKKAPERKLTWNGCTKKDKKCINYRGLFVNKNNIRGEKNLLMLIDTYLIKHIMNLEFLER